MTSNSILFHMYRSLSLKPNRTRILFCQDHAFTDGGDGFPRIKRYARSLADKHGLDLTVFDTKQKEQHTFTLPSSNSEDATLDYALLICGGMLEFSVTQVAFDALLEGLDVYILADQVATSQPAYLDHFINRLRHRSAQFLTSQQAEFELDLR